MNLKTLHAVLDCLIPRDDFPGANEAGVRDFLFRLFETDLAAESDFFNAGIEAIDAEARLKFDRPFVALTSDQQILTLQGIESGNVTAPWPISPPRFFEMLVNTTAEGFYSNPVSWLMTGFEEPSEP